MRRKSTRNSQKATPDKPAKEKEATPKTRRSRRHKRSPSKSSESEDEVITVTKRAPVEETPDTTTKSHTPTDEENEEAVWKVTSTEEDTPRGEIQKLKICLTRPSPDSPEKIRPRRSKSNSQTEDDTTSSEDKSSRRTRSQGSPVVRNDGLSSQEGDEDVEEKKGKGKSKGKHKSKIEKSPQLSEPELQTNNEISENVQVTPQSPSIDNPVDNENDYKVDVDDKQSVNERKEESANVDRDSNGEQSVTEAKDDVNKDSDDDQPLSVIQKSESDNKKTKDEEIAEAQPEIIAEEQKPEESQEEETSKQSDLQEISTETEDQKTDEVPPTSEETTVLSRKESVPKDSEDQSLDENISSQDTSQSVDENVASNNEPESNQKNIAPEAASTEEIENEDILAGNSEMKKFDAQSTEMEISETENVEVKKSESENVEVEKSEIENVEVEKSVAENTKLMKISDGENIEMKKSETANVEVKETETENVEVKKSETENVKVKKSETENVKVKETETENFEVKKSETENVEVKKSIAENSKPKMFENVEVKKSETENVKVKKSVVVNTKLKISDAENVEVKKSEAENVKVKKSDAENSEVKKSKIKSDSSEIRVTSAEASTVDAKGEIRRGSRGRTPRRRLKRSNDHLEPTPKEAEPQSTETTHIKPSRLNCKWSSDTARPASSLIKLDLESIQTVFPAVDFPSEPDLSVEIEKERRKSLTEPSTKKLERKVSVEYKSEASERPFFEKQTSVNSVGSATKESEDESSNIIAFNRKISIVDDTASKLKPPPSPAKNPVSSILYITNLVRPFTVKQLKELLERTGKIRAEGFWTDRIKSKCYVQYETQDEAETTRNALHGVQWPIGNGKKLIIDYASEEEMVNARNPPAPPAAPPVPEIKVPAKENLEPTESKARPEEKTTKEVEKKRPAEGPVREWDIGKKDVRRDRSRSRERSRKHKRSPSPSDDFISRKQRKTEESVPQKLMDDLFLKTKTTPSIYWQPLSPEEISMKQQQRLIRMEEHKRRMEENTRMKGRDMGRGGFRRRYD